MMMLHAGRQNSGDGELTECLSTRRPGPLNENAHQAGAIVGGEGVPLLYHKSIQIHRVQAVQSTPSLRLQ